MIRLLALAGVATALTVTALSITPSAAAPRDTNPYRCMIDEGYGRVHPCSQSYMRSHPNWRQTDNCMIDEGYGRVHPCSQGYQQGSWNGPQPSPVTPQR
jgi:hypothetical protein